jgi:putative endonuclease
MSDAKRAARAFGLRAETLATLWLRAQLFTILDRNYRVQGGEIDIVAQRGHLIVFVEVKARADLETAALAITPQKQRRIQRAVHHWLARHPRSTGCALRADAILIAPGQLPRRIAGVFDLSIG